MLEVGPELGQADEGVADGGRQRGLGRQGGELGGEPGLEVVEDGTGVGLAQARPLLGRPAARRLLDRVELGDASDRLLGDRGALRAMDAGELAPDVGQAGDLTDGVLPVQLSEARVVVRVHPAGEGLQMALRVLALPVGRELVPGRGRRRPAPGPLVADVDPHPCGGGSSLAGREHRDGGVVGEQRLAAEGVPPDRGGERLQQRRRSPDPVGQRRAVEVEPVTGVDRALAIERKVVAELRDQDVGQEPGPRPTPLDGPRGQRRLLRRRSQPEQARRGRVMRFTTKRPGTYSSSSVTSSPRRRRRPPRAARRPPRPARSRPPCAGRGRGSVGASDGAPPRPRPPPAGAAGP